MAENEFRLPGPSHRTVIVGRTGTGKTRFGAWALSVSPFDTIPYVVVDYKLEALFRQTNKIKEIGLGEVPKHPGLYIVRPLPTDDDAVEAWLWKLHQREKCGIYVDEGYGINRSSLALRAVLTQGRSKRLPVIFLSQRPAWISPFVVSEADFIVCFALTKPEDRKRIQEMIPSDRFDVSARLPDYHSYWYDVGRDWGTIMKPVPSDNDILDRIETRLNATRKAI